MLSRCLWLTPTEEVAKATKHVEDYVRTYISTPHITCGVCLFFVNHLYLYAITVHVQNVFNHVFL